VALDLPFSELAGFSTGNIGRLDDGRVARWSWASEDRAVHVESWIGVVDGFSYVESLCGFKGSVVRCQISPRCGTKDFDPPAREERMEFSFEQPVKQVAAGEKMCALLLDGSVSCWGASLEDGRERCNYDAPARVTELPASQALAAGQEGSMCALSRDGQVHCWGKNSASIFGVSEEDMPWSEKPVPIKGLDRTILLRVGDGGTAAVLEDGSVHYWGHPLVLEAGDTPPTRGPRRAALPHPAVDVVVGEAHACALLSTRELYCFAGRFDALRARKGAEFRAGFEGRTPWVDAREFDIVDDLTPVETPQAK
jgi:hypothetical protein